ncbi:MAG: HlyC/CorC family transporter [Gemmatimonadaceae bacterium]|nr:HlyC/CorC family transporter [Gemmatimonadaceae bacterium]
MDTLSLSSLGGRLAAVFLLVLLNGFFVMAEFALVGARRSRLAAMAEAGDRGARRAQQAIADLDRYISGTQLGITLASLALGWIGEPALAVVVDRLLARFGIDVPPGMAHTAAGTITAFIIITFLHIVLGELAPKSVALVMPEKISGCVALPLMAFSRLMSPFIWLLNGTANALLRLIGIRPLSEALHAHTPDELRLLVMQARGAGTLNETDSAMLAGIFDFAAKRVHDVMRPRTEIVALPIDATEGEVRVVVKRERYSRYPVYDESLDDIVGVFLSKDLWLRDESRPFVLRELLREPLLVPASRSAERVLDDLRRTRAQMAVVLDEFGGTAGIVTMEDLIEEVVGDIADEYDMASRDVVEVDGVLELSGALSLVDIRSDHRLPIPDGEWTTLGGYVFARLGRIPALGDRAQYPGGELEVIAMDKRRVAAVRVHRTPAVR